MESMVLDQGLVPSAVTCATRNWWGMPRVRPVTVIDVEVEVPSLTVVQVVERDRRGRRGDSGVDDAAITVRAGAFDV